jgi:hypothetical protein
VGTRISLDRPSNWRLFWVFHLRGDDVLAVISDFADFLLDFRAELCENKGMRQLHAYWWFYFTPRGIGVGGGV